MSVIVFYALTLFLSYCFFWSVGQTVLIKMGYYDE